ncbi:MAG: hypothetical protein JNK65_01975 [Deltaproteobacteria bacterium]|nr:hypothetical protein [Deltaproteobacteria bacterium]
MVLFTISIQACEKRHPRLRSNALMGWCHQPITLPLHEVKGVVQGKFENLEDGDRVIDVIPEAEYEYLLYEIKNRYEKGPPKFLPRKQSCERCLHLEIEKCEAPSLKQVWESLQPGDRIRAKGVWTKDPHGHPWMELHPVLELEKISQ